MIISKRLAQFDGKKSCLNLTGLQQPTFGGRGLTRPSVHRNGPGFNCPLIKSETMN